MSISRTLGATAAASFILLAGAAFLFVKTRGLTAQHKPSNLEYAIANFAVAQSIPQSWKAMNNPAKGTAEVLIEARRDFHDYCAVCHGDDGVGKNVDRCRDVTRGA